MVEAVTLVLDSGALTALAGQRARLEALVARGWWPPDVPSPVLTESLTGDHRRDVRVNRLLRTCQVREVGEAVAREAARLRHAAHRSTGRDISAVDALVVAHASGLDEPTVATGDADDLTALSAHCASRVQISSVR